MQKHMLVIWAAIAHIKITPGRVPPPISVRECSPLEVLPNGIFQKLSRVFAIRLFFFQAPARTEGIARAAAASAVRSPEYYAALPWRFITSSAMRPVSSAMLSNLAR